MSGSSPMNPGKLSNETRPPLCTLLLLAASGLLLTFNAGAYLPGNWLPVAIAMAVLAPVLIATGPTSTLTAWRATILALFVLQATWTAISLTWAGSKVNAWEEADRTLLYLLGFFLAFSAVRWTARRGLEWLCAGVLASIAVTASVVIARLALDDDLLQYFNGGQLFPALTRPPPAGSPGWSA